MGVISNKKAWQKAMPKGRGKPVIIAKIKRLVCALWVALDARWLGRKDSNPRMAESKSAALTDLATPQQKTYALAHITTQKVGAH